MWNRSAVATEGDHEIKRSWSQRLSLCLQWIAEEQWDLPEAPRLVRPLRFVSMVDADYPSDLFELPQPPLGLFVEGDLDLKALRAGLVGSRVPTAYALRMTREAVGVLVKQGVTIVSGGAIGIDTIAHEAALDHHGITWVVLGGGHYELYPRQNVNLFREVVMAGGALISEYPPYFKAQKYSFPERNRLIAALSDRLVLSQAHERSGSLSTARCALDLGREIHVLQPLPDDENFAGSQTLIQLGARSFVRGEELLITATT